MQRELDLIMEAGSSSFEEMEEIVPLGTHPYLFEPEASSDEEFNQQSSPESTNEDRLESSNWYVFKNPVAHTICQ